MLQYSLLLWLTSLQIVFMIHVFIIHRLSLFFKDIKRTKWHAEHTIHIRTQIPVNNRDSTSPVSRCWWHPCLVPAWMPFQKLTQPLRWFSARKSLSIAKKSPERPTFLPLASYPNSSKTATNVLYKFFFFPSSSSPLVLPSLFRQVLPCDPLPLVTEREVEEETAMPLELVALMVMVVALNGRDNIY